MTTRRGAVWSGVFALLSIVEFIAYFFLPPSIEAILEKNIVSAVAITVAGGVNGVVASVVSYWAASLNIGNFDERKEQCVDWLLGASSRWGPRRLDTVVRVANTAEGVIGVLADWRPQSKARESAIKAAVEEARENLIRNATDKGLPSVTLERATTHCTAMGLFALERISYLHVLKSTPQEVATKQKLQEALLSSATLDGWAFCPASPNGHDHVRVFSTLWALRALAASGSFGRLDVDRLLRTISQSGFGYNYLDTTPRLCIVALYALVVSELPDGSLRDELQTKESKAIRQVLFRELKKDRWTEAEVIIDPVEKKEYSWVHFSGALALGALAASYAQLSTVESMRLRERWHKAFRTDWHRDGFFFPHTDTNKTNPQTFPTTYYADALGRYLKAVAGRTGDNE